MKGKTVHPSVGPNRASIPSCCFSTAHESDSCSNVSLSGRVFQQPARAQQASKLETRALFAGSQGGTVARAGGNTCGPLSARLDLKLVLQASRLRYSGAIHWMLQNSLKSRTHTQPCRSGTGG